MNKKQLIDLVAERGEMTKKDAEHAIESVFGAIENALANHEKVKLVGFGSFEVKERAQKNGRNPQTGEKLVIPKHNVPVFHAGKELCDRV